MSSSGRRPARRGPDDDDAGTQQPGAAASRQDTPDLLPDTVPRRPEPGQQAASLKTPMRAGGDQKLSAAEAKKLAAESKRTGDAEYYEKKISAKEQKKNLALAPGVAAAAAASSSQQTDDIEAADRQAKKLALAPGMATTDEVPSKPKSELALAPALARQTDEPTATTTAPVAAEPPPRQTEPQVTPGAIPVRGIDARTGDDDDDLHYDMGTAGTTATSETDVHEGIPRAQAVTEDEHPDDGEHDQEFLDQLAQAEEVEKGIMGWIKRHKVWTALAVVLVLGAIVGGAVGGVVAGGSSGGGVPDAPSSAPSLSPTNAPTFVDFELIAPTLTQITPLSILTNPNTPQNAAADWLLNEDGYDLDFEDSTKLLQRYALATIYYATNGPSWTQQYGFMTPTDDCEWFEVDMEANRTFGVRCNEEGAVDYIQLSINNLQGTIPNEILGIPALTEVSTGFNSLTGTIPSTLSQLTNLVDIRLFDNQLTGSIPEDVGALTKMTHLTLQNNRLSGSFPPSIGQLSLLTLLSTRNNALTGPLPSTMGNLDVITFFGVDVNRLNGTVPSELSGMVSLKTGFLDSNDFTGSLDPAFCTGSIDFNTLQADCLAVNNPGFPQQDAEVECTCCTTCCYQEPSEACLPNDFFEDGV